MTVLERLLVIVLMAMTLAIGALSLGIAAPIPVQSASQDSSVLANQAAAAIVLLAQSQQGVMAQ